MIQGLFCINEKNELVLTVKDQYDNLQNSITINLDLINTNILQFPTYAIAVAKLVGRTAPARVLIIADEVNNNGGFGKYDYTQATGLVEDIL